MGIKFGRLFKKGGKSKLADINLAVTGSTKLTDDVAFVLEK